MVENLNKKEAYSFYKTYIVNQSKQALFTRYNFPIAGSVSSIDWELFAAILTGQKKRAGSGADLKGFEVKSAIMGNSFEYQYHLNSGIEKLKEDKSVNHLFISYSRNYRDVEVRLANSGGLSNTFDKWRPGLEKNYAGENPKQRFRKSISTGKANQMSDVVMKISNLILTV